MKDIGGISCDEEISEGKPCVVEVDSKNNDDVFICIENVKEEPREVYEVSDEIIRFLYVR